MFGQITVLIQISFQNGVSIYAESFGAMEMSAFLKTEDIPHGCKDNGSAAAGVCMQSHFWNWK